MRHYILLGLLLLGLISFSSCTIEENALDEATPVEEIEAPTLRIWSYSDEFLTELATFEEKNECIIEYEVIDANGFARMVDTRIEEGEKPDIIISDYASMMSETLKDHIRPLNTFSEEYNIAEKLNPQMLEQSYDTSKQMRGLSYHMTPIVIFYRRSLAKQVLGTDDPEDVRPHFKSMESIYDLGMMLKDHDIGVVPDPYALRHFMPLETVKTDEGVVNLEQWRTYLTTLNAIKRNKLTPFYVEWSKEWFAGMQEDVFSYVLPSWALSQILFMSAPQTSGDWGMVQGPYSKQWGGTWLSVTYSGEQQALADRFLEYILLDQEHQETWLSKSYQISSNIQVQQKQSYPEGNVFLGGQDYHQTLNQIIEYGLTKEERDTLYEELIIRYVNDEFHTIDEVLMLIEEKAIKEETL